jgi:hypothetical protein
MKLAAKSLLFLIALAAPLAFAQTGPNTPIKERKQDQKSRATAPFPSWRNGDRSVLAVKGSLRRKERALDCSGPL